MFNGLEVFRKKLSSARQEYLTRAAGNCENFTR
jgi:hypothetical protein